VGSWVGVVGVSRQSTGRSTVGGALPRALLVPVSAGSKLK